MNRAALMQRIEQHFGAKAVTCSADLAVLLEDICWQVYQWAVADQPQQDTPADPMDTPLPCDIKVGHVTIRKGCKLRTLVTRMKVLDEIVQDSAQADPHLFAGIASRMEFRPNADCSADPANCPNNEGHGCACDPLNTSGRCEVCAGTGTAFGKQCECKKGAAHG